MGLFYPWQCKCIATSHRVVCLRAERVQWVGNGRRNEENMDSKNDPRSVDWAPEQIAALKERLDGLISDTASEIESLREGIKALSEQSNVDRDRINELQAAIASKVRSELSAGFSELDPEFSPAIGRASDTSDKAHLRKRDVPLGFAVGQAEYGVIPQRDHAIGTGGVVQYEETWSKGYAAGVAAARDEMESRLISALDRLGWRSGSPAWLGVMGALRDQPEKRVSAEEKIRGYMTGHFSTGTIDGVVNALHDTPKPKPVRKIHDNPQA